MNFFEVFKINTDEDVYNALKGADVESVNKVINGGFIRVKIKPDRNVESAQLERPQWQ